MSATTATRKLSHSKLSTDVDVINREIAYFTRRLSKDGDDHGNTRKAIRIRNEHLTELLNSIGQAHDVATGKPVKPESIQPRNEIEIHLPAAMESLNNSLKVITLDELRNNPGYAAAAKQLAASCQVVIEASEGIKRVTDILNGNGTDHRTQWSAVPCPLGQE